MIIRAPTRTRYVTLAKTAIEDKSLSFRAIGLWAYLMSKQDNWVVYIAELVGAHKEGRTAVTAAMKELEAAGYIHRASGDARSRNGDGTWNATTTEVFERPVHKTDTGSEQEQSSQCTKSTLDARWEDVQTPRSRPVSIIHRGSSTADNRPLVINEEVSNEKVISLSSARNSNRDTDDRGRDEIAGAIRKGWRKDGIDILTASEQREVDNAVKELCAVGATAAEVRDRAEDVIRAKAWSYVTPHYLATHWHDDAAVPDDDLWSDCLETARDQPRRSARCDECRGVGYIENPPGEDGTTSVRPCTCRTAVTP